MLFRCNGHSQFHQSSRFWVEHLFLPNDRWIDA
nr:MAG TPA: hypothetical protein [Caudoviricetes sp.]